MAHWTKALALEPLAAEVDELGLEGADDLYLIDREMEARLRNKVCHALAAQTTHLWGSTRAGVILLRFTRANWVPGHISAEQRSYYS